MNKVVYNACYGGFGLSTVAVKLARKLSNNDNWGGITLPGEEYDDGSGVCPDHYDSHDLWSDSGVSRHDPILIEVVETLGVDASGKYSNLKICVIDGNQYQIDQYDGAESVETPETIGWVTIDE